MEINVQNNQTLFDLAMQYLGDVQYAANIAVANDISITQNLNAGDVIIIPGIDLKSTEEKIVNQFKKSGINPAGLLP